MDRPLISCLIPTESSHLFDTSVTFLNSLRFNISSSCSVNVEELSGVILLAELPESNDNCFLKHGLMNLTSAWTSIQYGSEIPDLIPAFSLHLLVALATALTSLRLSIPLIAIIASSGTSGSM